MATHPRTLRIESFEDRLAPATMSLFQMGFINPVYGSYYTTHSRADLSAHSRSLGTYQDYGASAYFYPRTELFAVSSGYGRPVFVEFIVWRGDWNTVIQGSPAPAPAPPVTSVPSSPETSTSSSSGGTRSTTHTTTNTSSNTDFVTDRSAASSNSNVSIPIGAPGGRAADGNATSDGGAEQANRSVVPNVPPVAFESRPDFGHLTVPVLSTAEVINIVPATGPEVPQSEEPPLAQEDPPVAMRESSPSSAPAPSLSASEPLAGLFPFNITAIETGVRGVIDRVGGLEKVWSETPANTEDYLWLAAAALVAGGVAQTAWTRRIRPTDPRTLGLDSVLARWGEKYVG
jgi:hypothetical protein